MSSTGSIPHIVAVVVYIVVVWSLCLLGYAGHMMRKAMGLGRVTQGSILLETSV